MPHFYYFILYFTSSKTTSTDYQKVTNMVILYRKYSYKQNWETLICK